MSAAAARSPAPRSTAVERSSCREALDTTVSSGGMLVLSAGTDSGTAVLNGGVEIVSSIDLGGYLSTVLNAVTSNSTVSSGGVIVLSSGGIAVSATVLSGGEEIVSNGAAASGTTVLDGGEEIAASNGLASGTVVSSGGEQIISGSYRSFTAGRAVGTTVLSGGLAIVSGVASAAVVDGGTMEVASGGM